MMGEITVGHLSVGGGDVPETRSIVTGLLGCRLPDRERPLSLRPHLRRRELEPRPPGAADPAGRERAGGGIPSRRQRPRGPLDRQRPQLLRSHRRQERAAARRAEPRRHRRAAKSPWFPVPSETRPAQPGLDRGQPPEGGRGDRRPRRLRLHARHGVRRPDELHPLLLRAGRQGGGHHRRALQRRRRARDRHHRALSSAR